MSFPLVKIFSFSWGLFSPIKALSGSFPQLPSSWSLLDFFIFNFQGPFWYFSCNTHYTKICFSYTWLSSPTKLKIPWAWVLPLIFTLARKLSTYLIPRKWQKKEWIHFPKGESTQREVQRVKGICTDRGSRKEKSEEKTEKERLWKEQITEGNRVKEGKRGNKSAEFPLRWISARMASLDIN